MINLSIDKFLSCFPTVNITNECSMGSQRTYFVTWLVYYQHPEFDIILTLMRASKENRTGNWKIHYWVSHTHTQKVTASRKKCNFCVKYSRRKLLSAHYQRIQRGEDCFIHSLHCEVWCFFEELSSLYANKHRSLHYDRLSVVWYIWINTLY